MRGTKARQIRRDPLPADLLEEAREKIREAAAERSRRTEAIKQTYRQVERVAANLRDRDLGEAWAEFNEIRAEIMRDVVRAASERAEAA